MTKGYTVTKGGFMSKLGVLAMAGVMLGLGGCASTAGLDGPKIETSVKAGNGVVFGMKGGNKSVEKICAAFASEYPGTKDDRCENQDKYSAIGVLVVDFRLKPKAPYVVTALVPLAVGSIPHSGIVKLRLDGQRPAYFDELVAPYHNIDTACYYSNSAMHSGVVCPKHNWDYRKDMDL